MSTSPAQLTEDALVFLTERHLATFTSLLRDGRPHVVPVGFTWDAGTATVRIITSAGTQKVRNAERGGTVVVCQVDGARWLALAGTPVVRTEPEIVRSAEARYAVRYRVPRPNPARVVVEIQVTAVTGSARLLGRSPGG